MEINYKISFRLLPYILAELVAFFYVDYILNAKPHTVSDTTAFYVAFATYFVPVCLMVIRIKSLLAKWALVLGAHIYLVLALDMLSKLRHADHLLVSTVLFVPGFVVLLIVVAFSEPPWDWRKLWDQFFQNHI